MAQIFSIGDLQYQIMKILESSPRMSGGDLTRLTVDKHSSNTYHALNSLIRGGIIVAGGMHEGEYYRWQKNKGRIIKVYDLTWAGSVLLSIIRASKGHDQ